MRILCVCLGNICRSPMAEAVLRQMGGDRFDVDSAGTGDWHIGDPPHGPAIEAAAARGYDLTALRARQIAPDDFHAFDLILAMDQDNLQDIEDLRPIGSCTPLHLFLNHAPETGTAAVPDPYFTGDFEGALDLIEAGARRLLDHLR